MIVMSTGAEKLVRTLEEHDVEYVFGVCGDTSVGLYRAFAEMDTDIDHILARDERSAGFMADAYARLSNKPGVCEGPSGGGATYLIPGIVEANDSNVPVIGLNTIIPIRYRGRGVLTELDQVSLFDPLTKWNTAIEHPEEVPRKVRDAFRHATSGVPGATHLSLPMDVLDGDSTAEVYAPKETTSYPAYRPTPATEQLDQAVQLLEESQKPVIVAGGGVHSSEAWYDLKDFAGQNGIPVAQTLTSIGCIGESPYSIGVVGENGFREYADEIVDEADLLLLFGTAVESVWTEKWSHPPDRAKQIIHADIDAEAIGKNYETTVALPGDLRKTIHGLRERTEGKQKWDDSKLISRHEAWVGEYEAQFESTEFPIRPERMVAGANKVLDREAVIISDPGTSAPYFAALYDFTEPGRHWLTPRAHGALGYTIPAVIGAHYARPDRQIVGFTGDGSVGTSLGELETLARLDLPVTVVVVNNGSFSWIEAGQRNYADFSFGIDFDSTNYAEVANEFGIAGYRVENAADYEKTLQKAINEPGPAVVDLPTRPLPTIDNVPVDWLEPGE